MNTRCVFMLKYTKKGVCLFKSSIACHFYRVGSCVYVSHFRNETWCCVFCCFLLLFSLFVSRYRSKLSVIYIYIYIFFFFSVFCFFFFFFFLSLYPPFSFFLSLSPPSLLTFPTTFFFFFFSLFLLSLSCFLCPLVLSVIVWLNKRVYKIKLIN